MSSSEKYDINKIMKTFFVESREMLDTMESCLLNLEKETDDNESINAVFRSVHSIKGSAGMFNFTDIVQFTHIVENILDGVRKDVIVIDEDLIGILLECHDYISNLIDEYEKDNAVLIDESLKATGNDIIGRLSRYKASIAPEEGKEADAGETILQPADSKAGLSDEHVVATNYWYISLRYGQDAFRHALDPQSFISYLGGLGRIINIVTIADRIPSFKEMDPESCYLGFEIAFDGATDKKAIDDVFEFAREDCEVRILPPRSTIAEYVKLINELPETPMRIGEILTNVGLLSEGELKTALVLQEMSVKNAAAGVKTRPLLGEIMLEEKMIDKPSLEAALEKQKKTATAEERKSKSIRIDAEKLDELINIVGELVITGANVRQISERYGNMEIIPPVLTLSRLVEDVRDRIMNIRMVQIGDTFKRFERVVRDLGRESGKEADLIISGGDTELDKTIVEKIADPIMHLIRNSLDHGIGTPDERIRKGKPRRGSVRLNAYHETGSIVIEIKDDGNGLDREKIYNKAVHAGLIQPNQSIGDNDLFQLIFEPGFTTAEKVTNISGRGVGMDVVKKNIELLRGTVVLESEEGIGMSVRIHLPLTMAIIDGFMIQACGSYYVVPLDMVSEVFEVTRDQLIQKEGANIINLRGEVLPFMRLRDFFGEPETSSAVENVVVVEYARKKAGLVADQLIGEFQTVIKPIGKLFNELQWASGATILGTGEVALILDVPRLIQNNNQTLSFV